MLRSHCERRRQTVCAVRPTLKPTEEGLPEGVGARKPWHLPPRGREVMKVSMEVAVG